MSTLFRASLEVRAYHHSWDEEPSLPFTVAALGTTGPEATERLAARLSPEDGTVLYADGDGVADAQDATVEALESAQCCDCGKLVPVEDLEPFWVHASDDDVMCGPCSRNGALEESCERCGYPIAAFEAGGVCDRCAFELVATVHSVRPRTASCRECGVDFEAEDGEPLCLACGERAARAIGGAL